MTKKREDGERKREKIRNGSEREQFSHQNGLFPLGYANFRWKIIYIFLRLH